MTPKRRPPREKRPLITEENEKEYWVEYKKTNSPLIREALVVKYSPLVKYVANKMHVKIGTHKSINFDDLVSSGGFGLLDAIEKYNPNLNTKFNTYAMTRISGSILDELRKQDSLPRSVRQEAKEIERTREILESHYTRNVTSQEICEKLGIPMSKYNDIMKKVTESSPTSLNDIRYVDTEATGISIADTLKASEKTSPGYIVEREHVKKKIVEAIKNLPEKEQQVLILYYYDDLTLKEIGAIFEATESRISQIHTKALQALRYSLSEIKKQLL